ncbi:hypothetical protein SRHO_G00308270 [Serrasalmus rhombeus]
MGRGFHRYKAIVKPMDIPMSLATARICLRASAIWLLSMVLAIPEAIFSDLHPFQISGTNETFITCAPFPHGEDLHPKIHSMASFLIFYVIPLFIISVYYFFIARSLIRSATNMPVEGNIAIRRQGKAIHLQLITFHPHSGMLRAGNEHTSWGAQNTEVMSTTIESRKRLAKTVLVFVGLFAVCWLPNHVIYLYRSYHYNVVDASMSHFVASVTARILAFTNSCVNPFALYLLSKSFQKQFNKQLCCCCPPLSRRTHSVVRGNTRMSSLKSTQNHTVASLSLANGNHLYQEG